MGRIGIKYEQVALIADRLVLEGKTPSSKLIRAELGEGSLSTITDHLRNWKNATHQTNTAVLTEMPERIKNAINRLWVELQAESNAMINRAKDEAESRIAESQEREKEMGYELSKVESKHQDLLDEIECNNSKILTLENKLISERERTDEALKRAESATKNRDDATRMAEISRIEAAKAKHDLERADKDASESKRFAADIANKLNAIQLASTESDKRAAVAEARSAEISKAASIAENRLAAAESRALDYEKKLSSHYHHE